jgi:hypothetical protein
LITFSFPKTCCLSYCNSTNIFLHYDYGLIKLPGFGVSVSGGGGGGSSNSSGSGGEFVCMSVIEYACTCLLVSTYYQVRANGEIFLEKVIKARRYQ